MKICYLASKFPPFVGGGETIVYLMARHLSKLGHDVTVITGIFDDFKPYRPQLHGEKFKIKYVPGFEEFCIGSGGMVKPLSLINQRIEDIKPDIIHVHNLLPQYLLSPIAETLCSKIVLSYHNTPNPPLRIIGFFENYNLDHAFAHHIFARTKYDSLVATSKFYQQWAVKLGSPVTKTHMIYSGVDVNMFSPEAKRRKRDSFRKKLRLSQEDILVTLPTRVIRRKGVIEGLRAINLLKEKHPNIKIFLPGLFSPFDSSFANRIRNLIEHLHLKDVVVSYKHHLPFNKMPSVYAATDINIVPSYYEGLGLVVLESLSMEIPTIGTAVSGINEILINESNGLIVPPRNHEKLAKAISRLILNPNLAQEMAIRGRRTVLSKFDSLKMAQKFEQHYKTLLK
ncbi:glycosyltransferase family 4 protein [Patescibacteria group bacterium]|nr:glycosyltransferase family 4 protein [Patescibacteria group bacterium]